MDHGHPREFGYSMVPEARDPQRLADTEHRTARIDTDDARSTTEKTVEGYQG
jgi:hypothetical protein